MNSFYNAPPDPPPPPAHGNPYIASADSFTTTLDGFAPYHQSSLNNLLHFFTTPLGMIGVLSLLTCLTPDRSVKPAVSLVLVHAFLLLRDYTIPAAVQAQSALVLLTCLLLACCFRPSLKASLLLTCLGYGLQDLAHWYTGEETFQQNTWGDLEGGPLGKCAGMFVQHVFYLQPLVCAVQSAAVQNVTYLLPLLWWSGGCYMLDSSCSGLPHTFVSLRALFGTFSLPCEKRDMKTVRAWAVAQKPPHKKTSHWWVEDLGAEAKAAFKRLEVGEGVMNMFRTRFSEEGYAIDVVAGMNELYISGPNRAGTSDQVFFTEHIDGPYILYPFCSVYRCIVGLDENTEISTFFPNAHFGKTAKSGDILAFDFNREPHFIQADPKAPNKDFRIVLKLHYAIYPRGLAALGHVLHFLNVRYNELFRALFLFTLTPKENSFSGLVGEYAVNGGTVLYNSIDKYMGYNNLLYVGTLGAVAFVLDCYPVFLVGTSYVHYCRYISTYYIRKNVNYGLFKRDVLFFKGVMLLQMLRLVMGPFADGSKDLLADMNFVGLAMIVGGYLVSMAATAALGVDGTYFGIELGFVKADYMFVNSFPYNCIPHPMILSQVVALSGMHAFSWVGGGLKFDGPWWWVVPVHCALYFTHMAQENWDVWDGEPWFKKVKAD
ncbi:hypothetical protein TeGR_g5735 [Tetraparma gracilis]|uniref:Phosphatidylethanolamine N-methyltransferase n=1 Tax=Tetraparma gracilis TaxID=2962635 RepID=A0ABQ6M8P2_9STRA|nr:hypothetical protein TeGR_g5735 [Tetraparma gracilis]